MRKRIPPDAFDYYFALGPARTYAVVARHFGVSLRGVTKRALKEGWQARIAKIEAEARRKLDEQAGETLQAVNSRHLKMLRAIQTKAIQTLASMPLQSALAAVRSLDLSIRQERLILGEPSERSEVSVEQIVRREHERWMKLTHAEDDEGEDDDGSDEAEA